jgi:hypothetical protein
MSTIEKVSLSLPADLFEAVSRTARGNDRSRSQEVSELIRTGLTARKQIDGLYREIAQLKERLATAEAKPKPPPPDARDFLTGWSPGTSKLRDELRWAEENRRQQEADAAEARRECRAWKAKAAELRAANASQSTELTAIQDRVAAAEQAQADAEAALAAELVRKLPWHFHVPIPIFDVTVIPKHYIKPDPLSWRQGFAAASLVAGLILFLTPHQWSSMRSVSSAAMGTWGDIPQAAARMHGGPILGRDTLLQIYALVRAGKNPDRLDACFEKARKLKPGQKAIDCSIKVPHEFELFADVVTSGPHAGTSRAKKQLERQREILETWERAQN